MEILAAAMTLSLLIFLFVPQFPDAIKDAIDTVLQEPGNR